MISEISINRTYPPSEPAYWLRNRGWTFNADGLAKNYSRNNGEPMEWSEALVYEMFMHLYMMKAENNSEVGEGEGEGNG
jgi:hypothetical protein